MATQTGNRITDVHLETPSGASEHHHYITRVRWTRPQQPEVARAEVVAAIKRHEKVYVEVGASIATVEIENVNGINYIRTTPDKTKRDNLLSLKRF